jgi:hypothetical protein
MAGEYPHPRNGSNDGGPQLMRGYLDPTVICGTVIRPSGQATAAKYDARTGAVLSSIDLATLTASGIANQLDLPIAAANYADDHYFLPCAVDDQDSFHIWGNNHDGLTTPGPGMHHLTCHNIADFANPASWHVDTDSEPSATLDSSSDGGTYTYHLADRLTDGTLLWFFSQSPSRTNSAGRHYVAYRKKAGATWSPLLAPLGTDPLGALAAKSVMTYVDTLANGDSDRAYIMGLQIEPKAGFDYVHIYGCWRTNYIDPDTMHGAWYLVADSRDFSRWYAADGTLYLAGASTYPSTSPAIPINTKNATAATISPAPAVTRNLRQGIYLQPGTGSSSTPSWPAVIVQNGDVNGANGIGDGVANPFIRLAWNGSTWTNLYPPLLGGQIRELDIAGTAYYRCTSGKRTILRRVSDGLSIFLGGQAALPGDVYTPNHCPIMLREQGVYAVSVPDGGNPKLWMHGNNARHA